MSSASLLGLRPRDLATSRPYVERVERESPWHDKLAIALWHAAALPLARSVGLDRWRARSLVSRVETLANEVAALEDEQLRAAALALRPALRRQGFTRENVARVFALAREASGRAIGRRHYSTQLLAGWWLLEGSLVEMATGEGKTIAATLPAICASLAGLPVHVITVNDYLAERDAEAMAPLYRFFGLTVGAVAQGMPKGQRRAAYACDITYASNKELAFDYLRDRAALGERASPHHLAIDSLRGGACHPDAPVLRGLVFGIVDEADSVFIDEARTPLILSRETEASALERPLRVALRMAAELVPGKHFAVERDLRRVRLSDDGRGAIHGSDEGPGDEAAAFASARERIETVQQALAALHLFVRDEHYVVVDGKVQIVDESTGRAMPDRAWEHGLHQMVEAKEGLPLSGRRETLARITYQRLFRRYLRLAGMSGTVLEVASEIGRTYGLRVVRVPLHRPSRRTELGARCTSDAPGKWTVVVDRVHQLAATERRPVLIGTRTVRASEDLSALLAARGIEHVVLNARQDQDEAVVVSRAGEPGRVTVATNMAGRGTDIVLGGGAAERGGLHVILTEFHESRRIDRQLFGRCARQGDPGSTEVIVALDDDLFVTNLPRLARWAARRGHAGPLVLWLLRRLAQALAERRHRDARAITLKQDWQFARALAFAGRGE
ncbi:MAG: hypothetical protein KIT17_00435 [Rubrivivax sp.]|nr:hypothetical protein [Rubrivivax sp.]